MNKSLPLPGAIRKFFAVVSILLLFTNSAFAALIVSNGDFSNLTGLTADGDWNHGLPNSWTTLGGTNYIIYNTGTVLNLDHAGTISQSLGTVDAGGEDVIVSFQYGDIWNGGYYAPGEDMITVELVNITTPNTVTKTVKNDAAFGIMTPETISITAAPNDTLEIRFTALPENGITPGSAAALDNVSVKETTPPVLTAISSDTVDATYLTAAVIDIDLTFSEPVSSTGLVLNLDGGGTCTVSAFASSMTATCDYTVGASENSDDLTVTSIVGTITDAATNDTVNPTPTSNLAAVKAIVIYNPVPPVLTEVTPVTTPTYDTTPSYTFNASEDGALSYTGDCSSSTTTAVAGNNIITFNALALGVHDNCVITFTDVDMMTDTLTIPSFKIIPTPNTVIVNSVNPWPAAYVEATGTGTGSYAIAPTPPLGSGALQMTITGPTGSYYSSTPLYNNTLLSDITKLSYSTYRSSVDAGNNLAIALQLNVDYDSTDASSAWQGRLVFEPYNAPGNGGTIVQDTWQNWDTLTGVWWMSGNAIVGDVNVGKACTQGTPCTWAAVKAAYPNAAISSALGFKAGSNWTDFSGFVDKLNVALESTGADTTYNFEFDVTTPAASTVTPVPTVTNNTTPDYTFTTDEAGTLTYDGSCSSSTTVATVGTNSITFNTLAEGTYSDCTITITDVGSNAVVLGVNSFTVDTTIPTAVPVSITSNNLNPALAKVGDVITVSFTTSESVNLPIVTIAGKAATVTNTAGNNYTATYTLTATETQGIATIAIDFTDIAGNSATQVTAVSDTSSVTIDTASPIISSLVANTNSPLSAAISFNTNENATSSIQYGLTNSYGTTTAISGSLTQNHAITLSGLSQCVVYHYSLTVNDAAGNVTTTPDTTFQTNCNAQGGGGGGIGAGPIFTSPTPVVTMPTPNPTPTTPDTTPTNTPAPTTPDTTPTPENTTPAPIPATNPSPETTPENNTPTPTTPDTTPTNTPAPTTPNNTPTGGTGGTTGGTTEGGNTPAFNPADATLDIGGGNVPEEEVVPETLNPADATLDIGGGNAVEEENSYTLLWTLLGLIALLNTWWFFVAKKNVPVVHRRD